MIDRGNGGNINKRIFVHCAQQCLCAQTHTHTHTHTHNNKAPELQPNSVMNSVASEAQPAERWGCRSGYGVLHGG